MSASEFPVEIPSQWLREYLAADCGLSASLSTAVGPRGRENRRKPRLPTTRTPVPLPREGCTPRARLHLFLLLITTRGMIGYRFLPKRALWKGRPRWVIARSRK